MTQTFLIESAWSTRIMNNLYSLISKINPVVTLINRENASTESKLLDLFSSPQNFQMLTHILNPWARLIDVEFGSNIKFNPS